MQIHKTAATGSTVQQTIALANSLAGEARGITITQESEAMLETAASLFNAFTVPSTPNRISAHRLGHRKSATQARIQANRLETRPAILTPPRALRVYWNAVEHLKNARRDFGEIQGRSAEITHRDRTEKLAAFVDSQRDAMDALSRTLYAQKPVQHARGGRSARKLARANLQFFNR